MKLSHSKGIQGENQACQYLRHHNWHIIDRNWHCIHGKIDIIAKKTDILVFFEVKLRGSNLYGGAVASLSKPKLIRIKKSTQLYLQKYPTDLPIRIDAILIQEKPKFLIQHIIDIIN